ncbi:CRISPR-associated protein Cas4 [Thiomicrorhabdus sp. 6S3-12]|uniref:CRISPR-associated protein Cas4 n=1 Tax=Thiomicrorhabdus sp. 6S3-12 TaxID=2819681 RepID=UPI001AADEE44|nr:CRISPR-associated protein Cas4 [Thiomicrorhabdus sp. 6S3-12]MBO1924807.1 CRISPR-associated protein Cas4 [Thiomicrorhabdus sp. 6S3-12]
MDDTRLIPLSALQHYAFCPRQCALIHNEQVWSENWLTAQGQQLHQRVDHGLPESRKGIRYERGVEVSAPSLGLTGKLDLVEVEISTGVSFPVEYKRGKPKEDHIDLIQLCAQALCLEEMLSIEVSHGAIWYWQTRHRHQVEITVALRDETYGIIEATRQLLISGITPKAKYEKKCDACSLYELCNPKLTFRDKSRSYVKSIYQETVFEEAEK